MSNELIGEIFFLPNEQSETQFTFDPDQDYNSIQIYPAIPTSGFASTFTINHVKVTCTTSALTGIGSIISGANVDFAALGDHSSIIKYSWDFGDGNTSNLASPLHTYQSPGTYEVCLTYEDSNGCKGMICQTVELADSCEMPIGFIDISDHDANNDSLVLFTEIIPFVGPFYTVTNQNFYLPPFYQLIMDVPNSLVEHCHFLCDEGSQILNAAPSANYDDNTFEGCDHMWKGIVFENAFSSFTDNFVFDAEFGISYNSGFTLSISNNDFVDNYVGVFFPRGANFRFNSFVSNDFIITENLLPGYQGQPSWFHNGYAGIHAEGVAEVRMNGGFNTFDRVRNGIILNDSGLNCRNNDFLNLNTGTAIGHPINLISLQNRAIFSVGATSDLTVTNDNTFTDVMSAIHCTNKDFSTINIDNNVFTNNRTTKITIENTDNATINIENNSFDSTGRCILLRSLRDYETLEVSENTVAANANTFAFLTAILCNSENPLTVSGNTGNGFEQEMISVSMSRNAVLEFNIFDANNSSATGISLNSCTYCEIVGNKISGVDDNAFEMVSNIAPIIYCNFTKNCDVGFRFTNSNSIAEFVANQMEDNDTIGLHYGPSASTGVQYFHGNIWKGANQVAINENPNFIGSAYRVNDSVYPPGGGSYSPSGITNGWFTSADGTNDTCGVCIPLLNGTSCGVPQALIDNYAVIANTAVDYTNNYSVSSVWHSQFQLFAALSESPDICDCSATLLSFYNNPPDEIAAYYEAMQNLEQSSLISSIALSELTQIEVSIESIKNDLDNLILTTNATNYASNERQMLSLSTALDVHEQAYKAKEQLVESEYHDNLKSVALEIDQLNTPIDFLVDLKQTLDILVNNMRLGNEYTLSNDMQHLEDLADQCLDYYTMSSSLSRALISSISETPPSFRDNCDKINNRVTSKLDNHQSNFDIFPNPTNGIVQIPIEFDRIDLVNMNGVSFNPIRTSNGINIAGLPTGVYFIRMQKLNKEIINKRVILID